MGRDASRPRVSDLCFWSGGFTSYYHSRRQCRSHNQPVVEVRACIKIVFFFLIVIQGQQAHSSLIYLRKILRDMFLTSACDTNFGCTVRLLISKKADQFEKKFQCHNSDSNSRPTATLDLTRVTHIDPTLNIHYVCIYMYRYYILSRSVKSKQ